MVEVQLKSKDYTIYNAGAFPCNRATEGMGFGTSVALNFAAREVVILGTQYAGEMKKGLVQTAALGVMPGGKWRVDGIVHVAGGYGWQLEGKLLTLGKDSSSQVMLCKLQTERLPKCWVCSWHTVSTAVGAADAPCVLRNNIHPRTIFCRDIISQEIWLKKYILYFHQGFNTTRLHLLQII